MFRFLLRLVPKSLKKWLLSFLEKDIASKGNFEDNKIKFLSKGEKFFLKCISGNGSINPKTGLPQYFNFVVPIVAGIGSFLFAKASGASNKRALLAGGLGALTGGVLSAYQAPIQTALGLEKFGALSQIGAASFAGQLGASAFAPKPENPQQAQAAMPFTAGEYAQKYAGAREDLQGIGERFDYTQPGYQSGTYYSAPQTAQAEPAEVYDFTQPSQMYAAKEGGLAEIARYNKGGINYLPSKTDHDEKDVNNYVRAMGYVEDGSGNGDKDEDTMLAQLADGEFVSRADAILGAGIMSGANPSDFKEMRRKGAKFFYNQQDQLKRIYDIVKDKDDGNQES